MTLYEAIFVRRSVRAYEQTPLDEQTLDGIRKYLDGIDRIENGAVRFEVVNADAVSNAKAPHYIFAYCDAKPWQQINVGYVLQKADLYLQSMGLGTCWLGMPKPREKAKDDGYCIMMSFGKTTVPERKGERDFKRFEIDKISNEDNQTARAARLAPSAINSQPWRLEFFEGGLNIRFCSRGPAYLFLKRKMSKIDLGIVTRHAVTALEQQGYTVKSVAPLEKELGLGILFIKN